MSTDLTLRHKDKNKEIESISMVLKNGRQDDCYFVVMNSHGISKLIEDIGMWWLTIFTEEIEPKSWIIEEVNWNRALEQVQIALSKLEQAKDRISSDDIYKYHEHNFLCIEAMIQFVLEQPDKNEYYVQID